MDIISKLNTIKNKLEEAKANHERAKGRMDAANKELNDAGFDTIVDLEAALELEGKKLRELEEELAERTDAFCSKYGSLLK
jgi:hypothetical protein